MQMAKEWLKTWICLSFLFAWTRSARPRFDVSTDMGMVLVPADAEVDSAIFRLRATDQDADFPLVFEIIATTSPVVRVENLPCTLYNKVCQANVILTRQLVPGRLHDFVVRVKDSKGDVNSMQATISVTNSTTPRDKIFPHIPSLIMVPEDTKPEKELDYLLVESNPWSGKPVYIELWQPKELFKIRQRQMGSQTKGIITLIGELDFETQSMYTLTMYATDPYTEPGKDTRNIAGLHVVVVVKDVQDVPPVFTLAPPLTKINNTVKPGDVILRVHAEDGDKGVPREVTYGLISEGNPFTPFFNVSETTGEIILARPLEELTKITHVGAPIVLKIVAEEIRTMRDEPPAQATIVELGLLLGEPGNSPPYFENNNYVAWMDENMEPGSIVMFTDAYITLVRDEDIGKAGVFALKLENNNGTFEISPAVAERTANFVITVRDNTLIDYEKFKSLRFKIIAQEVGPATNLSASVPVTIFLRDINDNPPVFDIPIYEVTLSENANIGTRVVQVHATDDDAGIFGRIQYVKITGNGYDAFEINPDTGLISVSMGSVLDREQMPKLELNVEARDEEGRGLRGITTLIINILDVNDNAPIFEKEIYEFLLNSELMNFTMPAFIKAIDADAELPNNLVRYEIVHGNYENKFKLNEETGELMLREAINKVRKVRQNLRGNVKLNMRKKFRISDEELFKNYTNATVTSKSTLESSFHDFHLLNNLTEIDVDLKNQSRRRRAEDAPLFLLTARAYDLGVPHLSNTVQIRIMRPMSPFARIVMFVMPGENPDPKKTAETLATITGSRVTIQEIKPYVSQIDVGNTSDIGKRSVVVARVEQNGPGTLVDVDKIRESLAENGFGIISGMDGMGGESSASPGIVDNPINSNSGKTNVKNISGINSDSEEVTVYKTENKLLTWLLVFLGLLLLAAIISLILCCICPSCPFYMEPRKRRIHSTETLVVRSDGRPKRHIYRKPIKVIDGYSAERKEAWSADPTRQHWQFNRRNTKNLGIASLPGDVVPGHQNPEIERLRRAASLRLHNGNVEEPSVFGEHVIHQTRIIPMPREDERIYMEDMEGRYSLRRHEVERGSDTGMRTGPMMNETDSKPRVREQHFYRDGNAEVLRLVTRGEIEDHKDYGDRTKDPYHANGKDILLQRFIEDQKLRRSQDLRGSFHESLHEADADRSMESHHRVNETTEILILPERLELQRQPSYNQRQHQQEQMLNADVHKLIIEHNYKTKESKDDEADQYRGRGAPRVSMRDTEVEIGEASRSVENVSGRGRNVPYGIHDAELVRQNALLTRLLLEKDTRGLNVPMADSSSFLETQSLPGQVAIATQTDRTAATQTEFFLRSRSDNEEAEEDPRIRRKSKSKGRFETKDDFKKMNTIWVTTPIPEESRGQSANKKTTPTRTKIEVAESRNVSISPDILKEISNSPKSGNSDDNERDENDKVLDPLVEIKSNKVQKIQKVTSKSISTSKKKTKEEKIENDSTTPSPDEKEKKTIIRGKIRKKIEKPPRIKALDKTPESEKSHFMEPSFRVLEKEISTFQQKIREFGDKKLKILKKEDSSKKEQDSRDENEVYDITKKCEVTVKRTKKTISRESSPTKVMVEQKNTNEEDYKLKDRKITKQQQNISSSDFEEFDKPKRQSASFTERTTQYDKSKIKTRNRSKLRRQTHLENSDTKSSSEKTEKSEDSESKTEKSKDGTSSMEMKIDSSWSSSKDEEQKQTEDEKMQKSQLREEKSIQSQKIAAKTKPTKIVDKKRKITSLKSKTVEVPIKKVDKKDKRINKSTTTIFKDKSASPTKSKESVCTKKSITSEEEKPSKKSKSPKSKESMTMDFDKFVKNVKGAVEKEISSLTQATKDALNINKSNPKKDDKSSKEKDSREIKMVVENRKQEDEISKYKMDNTKQNEKDIKNKSIESKDVTEKLKDQKRKSKSSDSSSPKELKSDDAISFIVIENGKSLLNVSEDNKKSKDLKQPDKNEDNFKKDKEIDSETSKQTKEIKETKKEISDKIDDSRKSVSEEISETKKILSDKIDETKIDVSNKIDKTEQSLKNKIDESNRLVSDKINESKQIISNKIDETKNILSSKIDETIIKVDENIKLLDKKENKEIEEDKISSDKVPLTLEYSDSVVILDSGNIENKIEDQHITDKIDDSIYKEMKKTKAEEEIDLKSSIEVNKSLSTVEKESIADDTNKATAIVSDDSKKLVKDFSMITSAVDTKIDDIQENIKDKFEKSVDTVTGKAIETQVSMHDEISKTKKDIKDKNDDKKQFIVDKFEESEIKINDDDDLNINKMKQMTSKIDDKIEDSKNAEYSLLEEISAIDPTTKRLNKVNEIKDKSVKKEQRDLKIDMLDEKSSSLPITIKNQDSDNITETHSEGNQIQINEESDFTNNATKVKEITKEILETEKIYASTIHPEQITKKESITAPSTSTKKKDTTAEITQIIQTKKSEILEELLNKEDFTFPSDANNDKEASSTEMTQLKQTKKAEMLQEQQEGEKESTCSSNLDRIQVTATSKITELAEGQASASELTSTNDTNNDKLDSNTESSSSIAQEIEKAKIPIIVSSPRINYPEKPILEITDAIGNEEEASDDEDVDDDSSSASDISNKTALRTRPYRTPRHSISSEGAGDTSETPEVGKTPTTVKSGGKARQRWSSERDSDPLLTIEVPVPRAKEYSKTIFPQKIEVTPMDKPKISASKPTGVDQAKAQKSSTKESQVDSTTTKSTGVMESKTSEVPETKQRPESLKNQPVVVSLKKKEHSRIDHFSRQTETRKHSPSRREKSESKAEEKKPTSNTSEQRKVEIRSKHLKLHVSHHYRQQLKQDDSTTRDAASRIDSPNRDKETETTTTTTTITVPRIIDYGKDPEIANARSRYMAWYQQKRAEMEKKRREKKEQEEEMQKPKWLRKAAAAGKARKAKSAEDADQRTDEDKKSRERAKSSSDVAQASTPRLSRLRIKPLVNVESEQLKAIVRQGRKLRRAEGRGESDPPVQIFAPERQPLPASQTESMLQTVEPRHHLTQHSEYKYEKTAPAPFYLHPPPPVPHPSPEHFQNDSSDSRRLDDDLDSGIAISMQGSGGTRLRHQQLLEKKSVFDIAYSEASPTQLRSDSSTPPS